MLCLISQIMRLKEGMLIGLLVLFVVFFVHDEIFGNII